MAQIPKPGSISFEDRVTKSVPYEWGYGSTPRIASLRDALYWKSSTTKEWINVAAGIGKCAVREGQKPAWERCLKTISCSYPTR